MNVASEKQIHRGTRTGSYITDSQLRHEVHTQTERGMSNSMVLQMRFLGCLPHKPKTSCPLLPPTG